MQCPKCGTELRQGIQLCTWCGSKFRGLQRLADDPPAPQMPATRRPAPQTPGPRPSPSKLYNALWIVPTLLIVGHFAPDTSSKLEAFQFSRDEVRAQLKAPSTANFDGYAEQRVMDLGHGEYQAHGFVEAQNSFGVPLRQEWLTQVKYLGHQDWETERLELDGDVIEDNASPTAHNAETPAGRQRAAEVATQMQYGGGQPYNPVPGPPVIYPSQTPAAAPAPVISPAPATRPQHFGGF